MIYFLEELFIGCFIFIGYCDYDVVIIGVWLFMNNYLVVI